MYKVKYVLTYGNREKMHNRYTYANVLIFSYFVWHLIKKDKLKIKIENELYLFDR